MIRSAHSRNVLPVQPAPLTIFRPRRPPLAPALDLVGAIVAALPGLGFPRGEVAIVAGIWPIGWAQARLQEPVGRWKGHHLYCLSRSATGH